MILPAGIGYRNLHEGEVVLCTDEYISVYSPNKWSCVNESTVGKSLLLCLCKYYRRAVHPVTILKSCRSI